jgi:hypothetical protein
MAKLFSRLIEIADADIAPTALEETAEDVFKVSQVLVPVDTGELKESGGIEKISPTHINVGYGTDHSIYPEFGVPSRPNYPQQPYLVPAMMRASQILEEKVSKAAKKLI